MSSRHSTVVSRKFEIMAKSLRSKRKRKFRALKRMKYKPKIDAKMKEIALEVDAGMYCLFYFPSHQHCQWFMLSM